LSRKRTDDLSSSSRQGLQLGTPSAVARPERGKRV